MALGALGKMAELRKDTYYAAEVAALRSGIACAFEARFYDEEKGLCVDSTEYGEDSATLIQSNIVSEHTNALAILNGLVRPEAAARILRAAFVEPTLPLVEAQPYFCTFVLLALEKAGRMDLAMKMLVDRWGGRMADTGTTSCHEEWGINGSWRHGQYSGFMRTLSHAWSAYPADFLIRRLAGLEILEPGCSRIRLDPVRIGADYELAIPLPAGEAAVRVRGGKIDIQVPPGVRVER
jgi:hypothetical protein